MAEEVEFTRVRGDIDFTKYAVRDDVLPASSLPESPPVALLMKKNGATVTFGGEKIDDDSYLLSKVIPAKDNPFGSVGSFNPLTVEFDAAGTPLKNSIDALQKIADQGVKSGAVRLEIAPFQNGELDAFVLNKRDVGGGFQFPASAKGMELGKSEIKALLQDKPDFVASPSWWEKVRSNEPGMLVVMDAKGAPVNAFSYTKSGRQLTLGQRASIDPANGRLAPDGAAITGVVQLGADGLLDPKNLNSALAPLINPSRVPEVKTLAPLHQHISADHNTIRVPGGLPNNRLASGKAHD